MSGVIAHTSVYTLPAMQFVCHLVVMGSTGNNVTAAVPSTTASPPQHGVQPLPDGYVANPDLGFAYKYHVQKKTWIKAMNVCRQEGAQLAVVDTTEKQNYLGKLEPSINWAHAGIIRLQNESSWINVNTGESAVLAIPWYAGYPVEDATKNCLEFSKSALANFVTTDSEVFFCEIPIHADSANTAN